MGPFKKYMGKTSAETEHSNWQICKFKFNVM